MPPTVALPLGIVAGFVGLFGVISVPGRFGDRLRSVVYYGIIAVFALGALLQVLNFLGDVSDQMVSSRDYADYVATRYDLEDEIDE